MRKDTKTRQGLLRANAASRFESPGRRLPLPNNSSSRSSQCELVVRARHCGPTAKGKIGRGKAGGARNPRKDRGGGGGGKEPKGAGGEDGKADDERGVTLQGKKIRKKKTKRSCRSQD